MLLYHPLFDFFKGLVNTILQGTLTIQNEVHSGLIRDAKSGLCYDPLKGNEVWILGSTGR